MKSAKKPSKASLRRLSRNLSTFLRATQKYHRSQLNLADPIEAVFAAAEIVLSFRNLSQVIQPLGSGMIIAEGWEPNMNLSQALTAIASWTERVAEQFSKDRAMLELSARWIADAFEQDQHYSSIKKVRDV